MPKSPTRATAVLGISAAAVLLCCPNAAFPETAGSVVFTFETPAFQIRDTPNGQRIEVEGFGILGESGKPMLPGKIFALAVPPGATVTSLRWQAPDPVVLDGRYSIAATPRHRVITAVEHEQDEVRQSAWKAVVDASYQNDDPYPSQAATLVSNGGYRGYQLVDVRVAPFRYHAASGRLHYFESVTVMVDYELGESPHGRPYDSIPRLRSTAREIVANFDQAEQWYFDPDRGSDRETDGFLIITTQNLVDAVTPIIDHEEHKGRTAHVVTVEWIDSQYAGFDRAARMRRFLRDVYPSSSWGISDLLLVGEPVDVPMREGCVDIGYGRPKTDFYFAELSLDDDDSWDLNGNHCYGEQTSDPIDFYSEINVGRIPWSDPVVVHRISRKSVAYELNHDPTFKKNMLVMGSFWWETTDTAVLMEAKLAQPWMADWTVTRLYEDNATCHSAFPFDLPLNYANSVTSMANGRYAFINWAGHGSPESAHTMGNAGQAFVHTGSCVFLDDNYPAIIWAASCSTANPAYDHLAREMIGQGAVGYVGSTAVAYGAWEWQGPGDGSTQSCDFWFTSKVTSGEMTQGAAHQWALRKLYTDGLWANNRYEMFEWTLHGNPGLGMSTTVVEALFSDDFETGDTSAWQQR